MHRVRLALAAAVAIALAGQVMAQPRPAAPPGSATQPPQSQPAPSPPPTDLTAPDPSDNQPAVPQTPPLSEADKAFLTRAYANALSEVQLGQLAVQKGTTIRTKQVGTRMAADHDQESQELMQLAMGNDLELPTQPDRMSMGTYQRLRGIPGSDFDGAFAQAVIQAHQRDIAEFRKQARSAKDQAVREFAQKYLAMMQQHLMMARSLLAPTS